MTKKTLIALSIFFVFCFLGLLFPSKTFAHPDARFMKCQCTGDYQYKPGGEFQCYLLDKNYKTITKVDFSNKKSCTNNENCYGTVVFPFYQGIMSPIFPCELAYCSSDEGECKRICDCDRPGQMGGTYRCYSLFCVGTIGDPESWYCRPDNVVQGAAQKCSQDQVCYGTKKGTTDKAPCASLAGLFITPDDPPNPGSDPDENEIGPGTGEGEDAGSSEDDMPPLNPVEGDPWQETSLPRRDDFDPGNPCACFRDYEDGDPKGIVPCGRDYDHPDTTYNECCPCNLCHVFILINRAINGFLVPVSIALIGLMAMIAGLLFITAAGEPQRITMARNAITAAIVGFVTVLLSWTIVNTIIAFATGNTQGGVSTIFGQPWNEMECDPDIANRQTPQGPSSGTLAQNAQHIVNQQVGSGNNTTTGLSSSGSASLIKNFFASFININKKISSAQINNIIGLKENSFKWNPPTIDRLNHVLEPKNLGIQNAKFGSAFNLNAHYHPSWNKYWTSTMGSYYDHRTSFIVAIRHKTKDGKVSLRRFPPTDLGMGYEKYEKIPKAQDPVTKKEIDINGVGVEVQPDRKTMYSAHVDNNGEVALYVANSTLSPFFSVKKLDNAEDLKMLIAPFFYQQVILYNPTGETQKGSILVSVDYSLNDIKEVGSKKTVYYQNPNGTDKGGKRALSIIDSTAKVGRGGKNVFDKFREHGYVEGNDNAPTAKKETDYNPGGISVDFEIAPGQTETKVFVYAAYQGTKVFDNERTGRPLEFLYTYFFKNIDDVIIYAQKKDNYTKAVIKSTEFVNSIYQGKNFECPNARWVFSQAMHSYVANAFLLWDKNKPNTNKYTDKAHYYLKEGGCGWLSTVDVAHETGIFEGEYIPWALKLQLKQWEKYVIKDEVITNAWYLQHDVGKGYEENGPGEKSGKVLKEQGYDWFGGGRMKAEENLNYVLLSYWYLKKTGDKEFIKEISPTIKNLLNSVILRDSNNNWIPDRDANIDADNNGVPDRTTFDFGEKVAISHAKENTYIGIKSFGAFIAGSEILKKTGGKQEDIKKYEDYAGKIETTLMKIYNKSKFFPISQNPDVGLEGKDAKSIVIFDGLTYLFLTNEQNKSFKRFIKNTGPSLVRSFHECKDNHGYRIICNTNSSEKAQITWLSKTFNTSTAFKYLIMRGIIKDSDLQINGERINYIDNISKAKKLLEDSHHAFTDSWYASDGKHDTLNLYPRGVSIIGLMLLK